MFCNKSCACSFNNTEYRSKENNPNWKNGHALYVKLAYDVYLQECTICSFNDINALEVHHIDRDRSNGEIDNLIVLCANHHALVHRGPLEISDEVKLKRKYLPTSTY